MKTRKYTQKQWNRFSDDIKEQLVKQYDIILPDYNTKKEKVIKFINKIDITQKEGQENFDKVTKKIDSGFNKVDEIFNQFDGALAKIGGDTMTKSLLDDPFGKEHDYAKGVRKDSGSKGKKPKKTKGKTVREGHQRGWSGDVRL